jgi:hypothetical protein
VSNADPSTVFNHEEKEGQENFLARVKVTNSEQLNIFDEAIQEDLFSISQ